MSGNFLEDVIDSLVKSITDAQYGANVASGTLYFDPSGMNQLAAQLAAQTAQVQQARAQSHHQLASVNPTAEISDVSGVNSAWRWLSSTAVEGTGLVSFQDNLKELDKLVEYFYKQVRNVLNAFEQTDSAASSSLNGAAASVFSGNRRPEDPPPGSYESMPGSGPI
jgi:hypothetical protein